MSERGVFAVDRGIWSDPDFADEPFTEREAFLWLVSEAAWRPTRVRVGSASVDLQRGQCAFSTRFMAAKWKWSEARVRRFFKRLCERRIIDAVADARATQITVCKYDRFQRVGLPADALVDAEATQSRRTSDAKKKQGNIETEEATLAPRLRSREELDRIENDLLDAAGIRGNPPPGREGLRNMAPILGLLDQGLSLEEDILPIVRSKSGQQFSTWKYVTQACVDGVAARADARTRIGVAPTQQANGVRAGPVLRPARRNATFEAVEELLDEMRAEPWDH